MNIAMYGRDDDRAFARGMLVRHPRLDFFKRCLGCLGSHQELWKIDTLLLESLPDDIKSRDDFILNDLQRLGICKHLLGEFCSLFPKPLGNRPLQSGSVSAGGGSGRRNC